MSSFGEEIRRERELREITLREISEATKISMRYLDALERNDFRHLPGGVFNKGFVRAYAQYIGIDPDAMVNAYLLEEQTQEAKKNEREGARRDAIAEPARELAARRGASTSWSVVTPRPARKVVVLLLCLLAAAIVLAFYLLRENDRERGAVPRSDSLTARSGGAGGRA